MYPITAGLFGLKAQWTEQGRFIDSYLSKDLPFFNLKQLFFYSIYSNLNYFQFSIIISILINILDKSQSNIYVLSVGSEKWNL